MKTTTNMPTMHPNGFVQYPLNEDYRLHIWAPGMPPGQLVHTPIHDHTFDFESTVIIGKLEQISYKVARQYFTHSDEETSHWLWGAADILQPVSGGVELEREERLVLAPGSVYRFPAGKFHESHGIGFTVTIMHKTARNVTPWAYVAVPWGMEPDNEFRRDQYHPDILMQWVERTKTELFGHHGVSDERIIELAQGEQRWLIR